MSPKSNIYDANLIVSVESRKGGVGKTTAALCLARLLNKKHGFFVLLLDLDLTGTNSADIADSPFWENDIHAVCEIDSRKDISKPNPTPSNFLKQFEDCFMAGKPPPNFSSSKTDTGCLSIRPNNVNIFGSHIDNIERPGILFDDLHSHWLLEFVTQTIANFKHAVDPGNMGNTALIIDNSPGYIGIAPAIHEWLTDRGPKSSKFLNITSPDIQDLHACEDAIANLSDIFSKKWETRQLLVDNLAKGGALNIPKENNSFFMRLVTPTPNSARADESLSFYKLSDNDYEISEQSVIGDDFHKSPQKYIAAIVNRVPKEIAKSSKVFDPNGVLSSSSLLATLLGYNKGKVSADRLITFDPNIESQFSIQLLTNKRPSSVTHFSVVLESLKSAESRLAHDFISFGDSKAYLEDAFLRIPDLRDQLMKVDDIVRCELSAIANTKFKGSIRHIKHDWLPGNIFFPFRKATEQFLLKILKSSHNLQPRQPSYGPNSDATDRDVFDFKKQILQAAGNGLIASDAESMPQDSLLADILSRLVCYSLPISYLRGGGNEELVKLFADVLTLELDHTPKNALINKRISSIARFLGDESIGRRALNKNFYVVDAPPHIPDILKTRAVPQFLDFYKSVTSAQARMLDYEKDCRFLIHYLLFIVNADREYKIPFGVVNRIAKSVVITKQTQYDNAVGELEKAVMQAKYFREFEGVLEKVLTEWEVQ